MNERDPTRRPNAPRKVIPVFYDVQRDMVEQQGEGTSYDLSNWKRRYAAPKIESWGKALKDICKHDGFFYDSETTLQWEKSEEIVAKVEEFLISHRIIPDQGTKMPISKECVNYDVFICHWHKDTQRNIVSVLRGMLLWKSFTPFVVGYGKDDGGSALDSDIVQAIQKSSVHVVILSPNFARSRRCLEEVVHIMDMQGSSGTSDASRNPTVLPIFYDTEPSTVRHQIKDTGYDLNEVQGSVQEREGWARALRDLSLLHGRVYQSGSKMNKYIFQWKELYAIVKIVEASAKNIPPWNYGSKCETIDEVSKELELQDESEDVFIVGVYGRERTEFSNLVIQRLGWNFRGVSKLNNVMEKVCQREGISNIVQQMLSDLIQPSLSNDERRCRLLLENDSCLVVLDDLGNDIDKIRALLEKLKSILRNRSLVVLASQFQHTLQELNVHKFINLSSLENKRDFLNICYTERDGIHEAFLSHLRETFDMLGLDVRLLNEDKLMSDSTCLRDAKVTLCVISKSFRLGEFKRMCTNAAIPSKIVYVSYGSYPTDESMPKHLFKMEVDFENAEFNRPQFKSMVNEVVQTLNERGEEIMGAIDFPVGLAQRSSDIECSIRDCVSRNENSVQCFGLVGMGGIGKTTLARSIFNKIHSQFERSFFGLNTKGEVQGLGLIDVQKKVIAKLLNIRSDVVRIDNEEHGKMVLSSKVKHINALIVLDDVDDGRHLEAFCEPLQSSLGPRSVIIITTRDQKIVDSAKSTMIFDIERLDEEMSKSLFYWHAFMKPKPPADLEKVSQSVIEACQGLPLSLKIIGSHLYGNSDREYWAESLKLLEKGRKGIFDVLRISFDGLDSDEKEAFLDISCFLIDEDVELTCMFLNACYGMGKTHLYTLKNKCLITTYDGRRSRIGMHDQLRDMGRHIIREEPRDRAWDEETANEILQERNAWSSLRGLSVWSHIPLPEDASDWTSLPRLRILVVKHDYWRDRTHSHAERGRLRPQDIFRNVRCGGLRWLRWEKAPFEELPQGLCSTNIRVLELRWSAIRKVPTASLPNLQHLNVSRCKELKRLDMMSLSSLRVLHLDDCTSLATLSSLPTTLESLSLRMHVYETGGSLESVEDASLPNLRHLAITRCPKLKRLALYATSLEKLDLWGCEGLEDLDCKGLSSLRVLHLDDCTSLATLSSLPTTLESLSLRMHDYETRGSLESVEDVFLEILRRNLKSLNDATAGSLESVEDASLPNLRDLTIRRCPKLKRLALHATSLVELDLTVCEGLEDLDCKGLSSLRVLHLDDCTSLATLSSFPTTLESLRLRIYETAGSLESVENASRPNLRDLTITIRRCPKLKRLALHATSVVELDLWGCEGLEDLDCKGLSSLRLLYVHNCLSLATLSSLPTTLVSLSWRMDCETYEFDNGSLESVEDASLPNLRDLAIMSCPKLKRLALHATSLVELDLTGCEGLEDLDCKGLSSLRVLHLDDCTSLATLSSLPTTLESLSLRMHDYETGGSLESVEDASLPNLRELTITNCPELKRLALHMTSLEKLDLWGCEGLEDLDCKGLSSLPTTLESLRLRIYETAGLESVEDASLPNLRDLTIMDCRKLKRLALHASSLEKLDLTGCEGLEDLDCKGLSSLRVLHFDDCTSLATLSSLPTTLESLSLREYFWTGILESVEDASLPNLRDLAITSCPQLKRLALHAISLEQLDLRGCEALQALDCKGLWSLRVLILNGCASVTTLSSLPTTLEGLNLEMDDESAGSLESVEDAWLPNLRDLAITRCPKLKRLALRATSLDQLNLRGCEGLEDLDCKGLWSLRVLALDLCTSLASLSSLPTTLERLSYKIGSLESVEDASLPNLRNLAITWCPKLKRLALHATSLEKLDLTGCKGLEDLHCKALCSLETLDVRECTSLTQLNLSNCASLKNCLQKLYLYGCEKLEFLDINGCTRLNDLDILGCTRLKYLDIGGCICLHYSTIRGWESIRCLRSVEIRGYQSEDESSEDEHFDIEDENSKDEQFDIEDVSSEDENSIDPRHG
ncbi:hypothetical protein KP509_08G023200 [Ceratopteris richardii]|uniref:TIR domain-containing protein n=1 Tax=Ceratopteris richardii TaxID=49495 RepID=A0A8T2UCK1_CERRI|nr:hypothetical protein KP509_08G023200 [Ceratopteris richardii]